MSEAETRAKADAELARAISSVDLNRLGHGRHASALAALGQGYSCTPRKRRYRPRGTWLKVRGRK